MLKILTLHLEALSLTWIMSEFEKTLESLPPQAVLTTLTIALPHADIHRFDWEWLGGFLVFSPTSVRAERLLVEVEDCGPTEISPDELIYVHNALNDFHVAGGIVDMKAGTSLIP